MRFLPKYPKPVPKPERRRECLREIGIPSELNNPFFQPTVFKTVTAFVPREKPAHNGVRWGVRSGRFHPTLNDPAHHKGQRRYDVWHPMHAQLYKWFQSWNDRDITFPSASHGDVIDAPLS